MIYALTILGLIGIPFYDVIFRFFPNVSVVSPDTRVQREMIAVIIALAIGLSALYRGTKPFKNKWLLIFVFLQLVAVNLIPKLPVVINNIDNSNFWVWKPLCEVICFLLMYVGLSSVEWGNKKVTSILSVMFWVGLAMAMYVLAQTAGFDQINAVKEVSIIKKVGFPERVGALGQPTLVAPFIAMLVPIALYLKKYIFALVMCFAVYLTHSQMAGGALAVGVILYICLSKPIASFFVIPFSAGLSTFLFLKGYIHAANNGRFGAWKTVIQELLNTKIQGYEGADFSFFGHGLGSFAYLSQAAESLKFASAHNEYLEVFYSCGIFGLFFFLTAIIYLIIKSYDRYLYDYRKTTALLCSFTIISLCAFGTLVWHLGVYWFYTTVIASLLINKTIQGELK